MPGKPARPVVSQAQRAAMYEAAAGHSTLGIPKKVGREFISASHGVKNLPEHVKQDHARRLAHALRAR